MCSLLRRLDKRRIRLCRLSNETAGNLKKPKGKKGKSGDALNKLLKYLLPIAGKRILLLLGLAIVRTAFSNRLARMQVWLPLPRMVEQLHCIAQVLALHVAPTFICKQETGPHAGSNYLPCTSVYQGQEVPEPPGSYRVEL